METDAKLEVGIGTREAEALKPARVVIKEVNLVPVTFGNETREKVALKVKHPDRDELIELSKAKVIKADKVTASGLWYVLDEDGLVRKNSTTALFMQYTNVAILKELVGKEIETVTDDDGYLIIKAY